MLDRATKPDTSTRSPRSLPARFPPGAWPVAMPADMTAALLGFGTTGELLKAISRGEAPRPTFSRLRNGKRVPVWALDACRRYVADQHGTVTHADAAKEDIGDLI